MWNYKRNEDSVYIVNWIWNEIDHDNQIQHWFSVIAAKMEW